MGEFPHRRVLGSFSVAEEEPRGSEGSAVMFIFPAMKFQMLESPRVGKSGCGHFPPLLKAGRCSHSAGEEGV